MRRRDFITLVGGAGAAWPLAAHAQQGERMRRIGVLMGYLGDESGSSGQALIAAFRRDSRSSVGPRAATPGSTFAGPHPPMRS